MECPSCGYLSRRESGMSIMWLSIQEGKWNVHHVAIYPGGKVECPSCGYLSRRESGMSMVGYCGCE